jgi:hypothetical protein
LSGVAQINDCLTTWTLWRLIRAAVTKRLACAVLVAAAVGSSHPARLTAQYADPIVLYASDVSVQAGLFVRAASTSGAGGFKMTSANTGWDSVAGPLAQPAHYFEATFDATAGVPYHVWLRLRAADDSKWNESVWVQFDTSVAADGAPVWRMGTSTALLVNLEDCVGCGVSGWGWQDNASWTGQTAVVRFGATGRQRIRVQLREDGVDVDQVVLSSATYATASPGALRNDTTIVPRSNVASAPALTRHPYLQQVTASGAIVVFATDRAGAATVRVADPVGVTREVAAQSTPVARALSGGATYYQHAATVAGLAAGTRYTYDPLLDGADLTAGSDRFTTGPAVGSGQVRFLAFGDSGVGSSVQRQLASRMTGEAFDFALHTGDVAYGAPTGSGAGTMPQLQQWFFDIYRDWLRTHPIYPSIGNHDDEAQWALPYRSAFVLPTSGATASFPDHAERYYSFDYGPVHVVVLDTELAFQEVARRQVQIDWLTRDLGATRQPWKVAVFHRSPYSAGGGHGSDVLVQSTLEPIFAAQGVSLVLSGHEHSYERTLPQAKTGDGLGITYIVSGGAGAPLYPAATASWTAASASVHHYLRGTIDPCRLTIDAVAVDGSVFDRTSLDRCAGVTQPYGGSAPVLPGVVQAERFDEGGEGRAYHDGSAANEGGQLRQTGVDLEVTSDTGGGHNVGWIFPGEWLTYTVWVPTAGTFDVWARVSSPGPGGTFSFSVDGVATASPFQVPETGGWQRWQSVRGATVSLPAGLHRVRIDMQAAGVPGGAIGNLNSLTFLAR